VLSTTENEADDPCQASGGLRVARRSSYNLTERMTLLVGENGAGKSQLLRALGAGKFITDDDLTIGTIPPEPTIGLRPAIPVSFANYQLQASAGEAAQVSFSIHQGQAQATTLANLSNRHSLEELRCETLGQYKSVIEDAAADLLTLLDDERLVSVVSARARAQEEAVRERLAQYQSARSDMARRGYDHQHAAIWNTPKLNDPDLAGCVATFRKAGRSRSHRRSKALPGGWQPYPDGRS
jgi:hypothetical protein